MGRDIVRRDAVLQNETDLTDASQALAIEALVAGSTVSAAAEQGGVSRQTLHRWLAADHVFIAALNFRKAEFLGQVRGELRALATDAIATLKRAMNPDKPVFSATAVRIKTALAVLAMVGADTPERFGSSDPDKVQDELDPGGAMYRQILRK
jgi:hypothetical protein